VNETLNAVIGEVNAQQSRSRVSLDSIRFIGGQFSDRCQAEGQAEFFLVLLA
jgi:hypothetical protein